MPYRLACRSLLEAFPPEVPTSQMTLACVELTKTEQKLTTPPFSRRVSPCSLFAFTAVLPSQPPECWDLCLSGEIHLCFETGSSPGTCS